MLEVFEKKMKENDRRTFLHTHIQQQTHTHIGGIKIVV